MQYSGQTRKNTSFPKVASLVTKTLVEHVGVCRSPYNPHISHMDPKLNKQMTIVYSVYSFSMIPG